MSSESSCSSVSPKSSESSYISSSDWETEWEDDEALNRKILRSISLTDSNQKKLLVSCLPQSLTDKEFNKIFLPYGALKYAKIIREELSNYSYGYGLLEYYLVEDAQEALFRVNGKRIDKSKIKVTNLDPSSDDIELPQIIVTNLTKAVTRGQLFCWFNPFGEVVEANVLLHKTKKTPNGTAFVRFNRREDAVEAIKKVNETTPDGSRRIIKVKFSKEYEEEMARVEGCVDDSKN